MIRFSAFLVVVAVGLLVAGVVTSKLLLVYIAIGVSGVALLALGIGAAVNWRELTGKTAETSAQGPAAQAAAPEAATSQAQPSQAQPPQVPVPAGSAPAPAAQVQPGLQGYPLSASSPAPAGSGWPATAPSAPSGPPWSGYLPATESPRPKPEPRPGTQPPGSRPDDVPRAPAAFTPRREPSAPGVWEFRDNTIQVPPAAEAPAPPRPTPSPPPSGPAAEPAAFRKPAPSAAPPTSPQPVVKPVPPRDDDIAEPSPTAERDQPPAKPVTTSKPEPASEAVPASKAEPASEAVPASKAEPASEPEPEPAREPEPVSGADPASEPELTLVPGATAAASTPATSQAEGPEQDKPAADAEPAGPDPTMEVTVAPGVPRYHSAHCTLIRFMGDSDLDKMTLAAAREIGCTPCRACLPDQPEKSPE